MSAAFSAIMVVGVLVLPPMSVDMIDASTTCNPVEAAHAQIRSDHGHGIDAHLAGADGVVEGFAALPDEGFDRGIAAGLFAGEQLETTVGIERRRGENAPRRADTGNKGPEVGRIGQVIRLDPRIGQLVGAFAADLAATAGAQYAHVQGNPEAQRTAQCPAVVFLDHRQEVVLQVGRLQAPFDACEATGFRDVAGERPASAREVIDETPQEQRAQGITDATGRLVHDQYVRVILQVLADAR